MQQLHDLLVRFRQCDLHDAWTTTASTTAFVEELNQLECLSKIASEAPDVQLTSEAAEQLKGSRAIFSRKAAFFYESMTLFPLGQHVMQVTNLALESHFRDIGFGKELEACVQMCIDLKTYTAEMVTKGDNMEIVVPNSGKVVDVRHKLSLIELTASKHFKETHNVQLKLANAKLDEIADALKAVCVLKYRN